MKHLTIISLFLAISISFMSCESVNKSKLVVDEFYELLNAEKYEQMADMIDEKGIKVTPREDWIAFFKEHTEFYGKEKSHSSKSFNTNTENGVTVVTLKYLTECEKETRYEKFILYKSDNEFKIVGYKTSDTASGLED